MDNSIDLKQYLDILRRWWWLMVACVLVASVSSYIGTLGMPRIYQATTTVMVGQTLQQANPSSSDLYISQQLAQTYAEMVKRRPVLAGAAGALGLEYVPSGGSVSTRQVPGTQLLEISVRDTIPERAAALADEIARQLILQSPTESESAERQAFVRERLEGLEANIQATEEEIAEEQEKLEASNSARAIQQYQQNISALQQKLSSYESTYASLLLSAQGGTNYISVIEPATTPRSPISPNVRETVLLAAAIGLALAVGGAVLIEFLDDTVKSPEEAIRLSGGMATLAAIPRIEGEGYDEKLVASKSPLSPISEAYRVLRTNVEFSSVDEPLRTLMVTSPGPSEGKSVTLANLGVVFAQADNRTLVVDTDLRRPVQHKIFNLSNEHGFCDAVLDAGGDVEDYAQETAVENLYVMPSGSLPPNPAELLGSQRAQEVVAGLRERFDVVLFDSPPVLVVTDAAVLSARADGVLLINDLGTTRRNMAKRAAEELERARANVLGLILNRMAAGAGGSYYYQYYYYYSRDGERVRKSPRKGGILGLLPDFLGLNGNGNGHRRREPVEEAKEEAEAS